MLQNEASLAIVAVHTAENEPLKIWGYSFNSSVTSLVLSLQLGAFDVRQALPDEVVSARSISGAIALRNY